MPVSPRKKKKNNMRILLIYGTNTSGTYEAGTVIRDVFKKHRHTVTLKAAKNTKPQDVKRYDAAIFASCTWGKLDKTGKYPVWLEGQMHWDWDQLAAKFKKSSLKGTPIAVVGLGDSNYKYFCRAATYLEDIVKLTEAKKIGTSLRIDRFHHTLRENRRKVEQWADATARRFSKLTHA
jgi:flavodoxin